MTVNHDDMDIDGARRRVFSEYDSLNSMDAWLTQESNTNNSSYTSTVDNQLTSNLSKKTDKNKRHQRKYHLVIQQKVLRSAQMTSSAAANDIHNNVDDNVG